MERNINYTVDLNEIHPKSPQYAGVQGEHKATEIKFSFSQEFHKKLEEISGSYDYVQFRIDYTDSLGNVVYGEVKDIGEINETFYLTRAMTKVGGNGTAVLKISCFNFEGTEKEFYTGVMRFYFESCPSVLLSDDEQGSVLSPIVNQARIYRNEAYDCARFLVETENNVKSIVEENKALTEQTENNVQTVLDAAKKAVEIEGKINDTQEILSQCQEATDLAKDAAEGVVTIEQNRQLPLKISVMTKEEYEGKTRPDPDGCVTLDFIEGEVLADLIYPVGSIYMSVNSIEPSTLFGGTWERIKDRFLLSCGDTYVPGSIGGEAKSTITADHLPSHSHVIGLGNDLLLATEGEVIRRTIVEGVNTGVEKANVLTSTTPVNRKNYTDKAGNNIPLDIMPPYMAVYMWKRVS